MFEVTKTLDKDHSGSGNHGSGVLKVWTGMESLRVMGGTERKLNRIEFGLE